MKSKLAAVTFTLALLAATFGMSNLLNSNVQASAPVVQTASTAFRCCMSGPVPPIPRGSN
ncbi:MAG: hypothetical protein ACRD1C_09745 [Terriglobales bacterium]